MTARVLFAIGVAGLLALFAAARFGGSSVMPSYLAVWLFGLALPVGALPLAMAADLLGRRDTPIVTALRRLLTLMPLVAALAIPVLVDLRSLTPPQPRIGFAAAWAEPALVLARGIVFLAAWVGLAFLFRRPPMSSSGRQGFAAFGLALHMLMGTFAATDWIGAVDPALYASGFGLLIIVAQAGTALAAACLLASRGSVSISQVAPALLILLAAWMFLHFTQYLVIWSANLPDEVLWYIRRVRGLGLAFEIAAAVAVLAVLVGLLGWPSRRMIDVAAGVILAMHFAEMLWLVIPASRETFSLTIVDGLAVCGLGGVVAGALILSRGGQADQERPHRASP